MARVFLSAGHGGSDPGVTAFGLKEKDINLNILLSCKDELIRHGVEVFTSRTKDENDPVTQEVREANSSGAIVAVSFHANAGKGDGSETFYFTGSSNGEKLALLCEKHTKAIGQNSRGAKGNKSLYFLKHTKMPAVLCECAFVDNNKDNDIIDTLPEQKKFGVAYAKAILEYLGIKWKSKSEPSNPTQKPSSSSSKESFLVKIDNVKRGDRLNIRERPDADASIKGTIEWDDPNKYTIIKIKQVGKSKWGKLKSGIGWINLYYTKRV